MSVPVVEKQNVERVGDIESKRFSIQASPESFRILSDGLYSDKVSAVIRELGTNAIDSHIEAGNNQPFHVHLPSYDEPWFKIRDFGTGLSHDDIMNLYSTYFGTNKTENPNLVGQLGLGSKSPLAYARSFSVTSYLNGHVNHYVVTLDEDRIPQINHMVNQSGPTSEPNGMEIQIAARINDVDEFARKASNIYKYFSIKPFVTGGNNKYIVREDKPIVEGNGWRVYEGVGKAKAIMGCIAYPIDGTKVHEITQHNNMLLNTNIEIDFPIGSLEFTPSRETLSYKKRTSEIIRNRLNEITVEINNVVSKKFDDCKSLWEARVLAYSLMWSGTRIEKLADLKNMKYKDNIIDIQSDIAFVKDTVMYVFTMGGIGSRRRHRNSKTIRKEEMRSVTVRNDVVWCEVDMPRGSYARCEEIVRNNNAKAVYLVDFSTLQAKKDFCERVGLNGDEFIKTSTLPKPMIKRGDFRSTEQVFVHRGYTNAHRLYSYWDTTDISIEDGGVYVELKRYNCVHDDKTVGPDVVGQIINAMSKIGYPIKVYGVRPSVAKQFRESDNWVDIFTYTRNIIKEKFVKSEISRHSINAKLCKDLNYLKVWDNIINDIHKLHVDESSVIIQFLNKVKVLINSLTEANRIANSHHWDTLFQCVNYKHDNDTSDYPKIKDEEDKLIAHYPMLKYLLDNKYYERMTDEEMLNISNYIKVIDQKTA